MTESSPIVSVRALIQDERGQVLIVRRPYDSGSHAGFYELPGGKVDPGETAEAAVVRECDEETGLKVEIVGDGRPIDDYPIHDGERQGGRLISFGFLCRIIGGEIGTGSEQMETNWLPLSEVIESSNVKPASRKAAALLCNPPDTVNDTA